MAGRVFGNSSGYNPGTAANPYGETASVSGGGMWGGGLARSSPYGDAAATNSALQRTGSNYRVPQQQAPAAPPLQNNGGGQIVAQDSGVPLQQVQQQQAEQEKPKSSFNWQSILGMLL